MKARREHDAGLGLSNRGFRRDLQPVGAVRHVEVGHYHRELGAAAQEDEGLVPVAGGSDLEALRGQGLDDDAAEIVFVFNKQHVDRHLNALVREAKANAGSFPSSLWSSVNPPDWAVKPNTWLKPSPLPLPMGLVVKNGSNTLACWSASIPEPSSRMLRQM